MHLWTTSDFLLRKEASRFFRFDGMPLRKSFEGCGERDGRKKWSADFSKIFSAEITLFYPSPIWLILFSLYRFTDKSSTKRTPLSIHTAKVWVKIFHATRFFKSSRVTYNYSLARLRKSKVEMKILPFRTKQIELLRDYAKIFAKRRLW